MNHSLSSSSSHPHLCLISSKPPPPKPTNQCKATPTFTCRSVQLNASQQTVQPSWIGVAPIALNPIQKLAASALDVVENFIVTKLEKNNLNKMKDPVIQLEGNYAPVPEFPVQHGLEVLGTIPKSVEGVYLRNGGNPQFYPISGHHFFDGDGMVHAVTLSPDGNQASYAARFTRTNRFLNEAAVGKSLYPKPIGELNGFSGLARLALFGTRALIGVANALGGIGVANVNCVYFNGRLLALSEDDLPYTVRITDEGDLETIGKYDFDGQVKDYSVIAHPKVDPETGDLYTFSYNVFVKPHLKFFRFASTGEKTREVPISLPQPTMFHDFAMTENNVIIPDHQVVFRMTEMFRGGTPVISDTNKVSRFGVMPKDATNESMIQWIDVPDCFCFHTWNAWEEINEHGEKIVVVINSCMTPADSIFTGADDVKVELSEIRLNLSTGRSTRRVIVSGMNLEAGQVNKLQLGKKIRYVYIAIADPFPKVSGLAKVDLTTGDVTKYLYGENRFGGEPCFVPSKGDDVEEEEEGYLMCHVRDEGRETSELVILKASTMEEVSLVKLPARVPFGFHGTFVSSEELAKQRV